MPGVKDAALALRLGRPRLALACRADPLTHAAAWLRLGEIGQAREILGTVPPSARAQVLLARSAALAGERAALSLAHAARQGSRREGDAGALIAAATLCGELERAGPHQALRSLAEGLKVAELLGTQADAHLLAVLAHVQRAAGGAGKAQRTAGKALDRADPGSPAQVLALLALGRPEEARVQAEAGELAPAWWGGFAPAY